MKKFTRIIGIIAIVAVIGLSMAACDNGSGGDSGSSSPLDGTWYWGVTGNVIRISGSSGTFTQFGSDALWRSAVSRGYVKNGDRYYRNLSRTGEDTWSGQSLAVTFRTSSPNNATGTEWVNCTITLNSNGQTLRESWSGGYLTMTRR